MTDELRFRRSKLGGAALLLVSVAALAFLVWSSWPTDPIQPIGHPPVTLASRFGWRQLVLALLSLGSAILAIGQLRRARHDITVDARGLLDRSVRPDRIAWHTMKDVSLVHVDRDMYVVRIALEHGLPLDIDLWGVRTPADAVFSEIVTRWQRARSERAGP